MPSTDTEFEMVSVRIKRTDRAALNEKALRQDCTLSDILRQLIAKAAREERRRLTEAR